MGDSLIIFLQGGGWCYLSEIQQLCEPASSHCTANCHIRASTSTGSSKFLLLEVPPRNLEGGTGYLSGDATEAGGFSGFAVAYLNYCDGGSFSGTMTTPDVALNGTRPLFYSGKSGFDDTILVDGTNVKEAVNSWYFSKEVVKKVDGPYPSNPTCPSVRKQVRGRL